jgi:hypothetical protein
LQASTQDAIAAALAAAITDLRARDERGQREPMTTVPKPGPATR